MVYRLSFLTLHDDVTVTCSDVSRQFSDEGLSGVILLKRKLKFTVNLRQNYLLTLFLYFPKLLLLF